MPKKLEDKFMKLIPQYCRSWTCVKSIYLLWIVWSAIQMEYGSHYNPLYYLSLECDSGWLQFSCAVLLAEVLRKIDSTTRSLAARHWNQQRKKQDSEGKKIQARVRTNCYRYRHRYLPARHPTSQVTFPSSSFPSARAFQTLRFLGCHGTHWSEAPSD